MLHRRFLAAGLALIGSLIGLLFTADHLRDDIVKLQSEREKADAEEATASDVSEETEKESFILFKEEEEDL